MKRFLLILTVAWLAPCTAQAQGSDRVELLRSVLRATVRGAYPWNRLQPSLVLLNTIGPCRPPGCEPDAASLAGTLPESLRAFVRDSLDTRTLGSEARYCTTNVDPPLLMLGEPLVQGDTAHVGVAWVGCCTGRRQTRCHPEGAIFDLVRAHGTWSIAKFPTDTIA